MNAERICFADEDIATTEISNAALQKRLRCCTILIANSDVNSYRNRFMLVFKPTFTATPVPVTKQPGKPWCTGNANSTAGTAGDVSVHPNPVSKVKKLCLSLAVWLKANTG